jgi:spore maturation protein CgeB
MRILLFYHSLVSDWNHGNAHFLRGIASELLARGHDVEVYEPRDSWSRINLIAREGPGADEAVFEVYPQLKAVSHRYDRDSIDLDRLLDGADLVLVHEWNDPSLVAAIGRRRRTGGFKLLFHDTHHRSVSDPAAIGDYDLRDYDGVLAFGALIRDLYRDKGWAREAWTWHEAADTRIFAPLPADLAHQPETGGAGAYRSEPRDLVWIGNWGDSERDAELRTFLLEPIARLGLSATLHGVRWPETALIAAREAGADYYGWLPNYRVPEVFAAHRVTLHVPRGPYARQLKGIPTIRPFEALACGIPLICSPWDDSEGLFRLGEDYLSARDGGEMAVLLRDLLHDPGLAQSLARSGRERILARHTCAHRVDELLAIVAAISAPRHHSAATHRAAQEQPA